MGKKKEETTGNDEDEATSEEVDETETDETLSNDDDKPTIKKVKTATLNVAKVEDTEWLKNEFASLNAKVDSMQTQIQTLQEAKVKTTTRTKFLHRKKR